MLPADQQEGFHIWPPPAQTVMSSCFLQQKPWGSEDYQPGGGQRTSGKSCKATKTWNIDSNKMFCTKASTISSRRRETCRQVTTVPDCRGSLSLKTSKLWPCPPPADIHLLSSQRAVSVYTHTHTHTESILYLCSPERITRDQLHTLHVLMQQDWVCSETEAAKSQPASSSEVRGQRSGSQCLQQHMRWALTWRQSSGGKKAELKLCRRSGGVRVTEHPLTTVLQSFIFGKWMTFLSAYITMTSSELASLPEKPKILILLFKVKKNFMFKMRFSLTLNSKIISFLFGALMSNCQWRDLLTVSLSHTHTHTHIITRHVVCPSPGGWMNAVCVWE